MRDTLKPFNKDTAVIGEDVINRQKEVGSYAGMSKIGMVIVDFGFQGITLNRPDECKVRVKTRTVWVTMYLGGWGYWYETEKQAVENAALDICIGTYPVEITE